MSADRTIPSPTSGRTIPAPDAGGGGGGGNPWKDWVELPLDPTDGWTIVNGVGSAGNSATVTKVGSELHFKAPSPANMRIQGAEMKGTFMARSIHIKPWEDAGIVKPSGQADNQFQPESMQLKIEVTFATSNGGPISGGTVVGQDGQNMVCIAGLAGYSADQSGSPTTTGYNWLGAIVEKNLGGDPSTSTSVNMYKAGFKSYFTTSGTANGYTWKNMQSPPAQAHDAIVFATSPLRKGNSTAKSDIFGGSYSSDTPFYPMASVGESLFDNSCVLSNTAIQNFWHIALWFGTRSTAAGAGEVRISRIRYILQPRQYRNDLA
jgi:hypothetical protein